MDVLYPKEFPSKALFITEGRFKSEAIISRLGAISVSVQGVSSWKGIDALIAKIERIAAKRYEGFTGFKNICIAEILVAVPFHRITYNRIECFGKQIGRMYSKIQIISAVAATLGKI